MLSHAFGSFREASRCNSQVLCPDDATKPSRERLALAFSPGDERNPSYVNGKKKKRGWSFGQESALKMSLCCGRAKLCHGRAKLCPGPLYLPQFPLFQGVAAQSVGFTHTNAALNNWTQFCCEFGSYPGSRESPLSQRCLPFIA